MDLKNLYAPILDFISKNKYLKIFLVILSLLILIFIIRSCSSDNTPPPRTVYTIARDGNWPSLELTGKERNMGAFADELLVDIAVSEKVRIEIFGLETRALFDALDSDNYDAILVFLTPNSMIDQKYLYTEPFFYTGPVLVVSSSSNVTSLDQMGGKIVGMSSGSTPIFNVKHPELLIVSYDNILKALDDLDSKKIDGVILSSWQGYVYTKGFFAGRLKVATPPLTGEGLRLVTKKFPRDEQLIKAFNTGIESYKKNGTYIELLKKWGLLNTNPSGP